MLVYGRGVKWFVARTNLVPEYHCRQEMLSYIRQRLWHTGEETSADELPTDTWSLRGYTSRKYAALVESMLQRTLPSVGEYAFSCIAAPSDEATRARWQEVWPNVEADLRSVMRRKLGVTEVARVAFIRLLRLRGWARQAPPFWPNPWLWARAKALHATLPAEEEPHGRVSLAVLVLNCTAFLQLCNFANLARFVLIDKDDEYQLIMYILANRGYHFLVYGLIQTVQNASAYFECVLSDVGERHPCSSTAPGRHEGYEIEFFMEMVRVATAWWAVRQLYSARCRGGKPHVVELERRRLGLSPSALELLKEAMGGADDEATGRATGSDAESAKDAAGQTSQSAACDRVQSGLSSSALPHVMPGLNPAAGSLRRRGLLAYLFIYDASAWIFCYTCGFLNLWWQARKVDCSKVDYCDEFRHEAATDAWAWLWPASWRFWSEDWRFWMTLDFSETTYSLLLLPYALLLAVRPLRLYITLAKPTGYDRGGQLQASLTAAEKVQRKEEAVRLAAARIQMHLRVKFLTRARSAGRGRAHWGAGHGAGPLAMPSEHVPAHASSGGAVSSGELHGELELL